MKFSVRTPVRHLARRHQWVPSAVLLCGCALTAAAVVNVASREEAAAASTFRADTLAVHRLVQAQFDATVGVTHAASALLAVSPEINFTEFRAFVSELQLPTRYPGLEGIGFAPRIGRRGLNEFVRTARLDGVNLAVRPSDPRAEYFPVVLMDPGIGGNTSAVGFDLASEPAQRAAMDRARDSNTAAVTELFDTAALFGAARRELILYLPVYQRGAAVASVQQRRRALIGFVFSRLSPETMFAESMAAAASRALAIAIYDSTTSADALLVSSGEPPVQRRSTAAVLIGGREWFVVASALDGRSGVLPPEAQRILIAGALLSLLLFALLRGQVRAWHLAEMHAAELRATDRAKDEFLAVLSHELRTPLNAMLGWVSMLRNGSVSEDRQARALEIIERNAQSQSQLIEDLLEVSRIVMGKVRLETRPMAVVAATTAVVDLLRPEADAKGVTLHGVEAGTGEDPMVVADPPRFAQIITNLVSNGLKFTPAGGAVWVNVDVDADIVRISVRDTGVGISPDFLPYVFDRFRQADSSTTRTHGGLGMGLAIVQDLVRLHQGSIAVYSNGAQQGSLFVVTLPRMTTDGDGSNGAELVAGHA
jgi:signal transduction histidine kinase